jgi:hypothetical protein
VNQQHDLIAFLHPLERQLAVWLDHLCERDRLAVHQAVQRFEVGGRAHLPGQCTARVLDNPLHHPHQPPRAADIAKLGRPKMLSCKPSGHGFHAFTSLVKAAKLTP